LIWACNNISQKQDNTSLEHIIELLIKSGVKVNAVDKYGNTALMFASFGGSVKILSLLLENGADLFAKNSSGYTTMDCAGMCQDF
jgi:uncharacterized protein